ncbi:MAG: GNAT family N-acetyltransferase [Acidimicrobiales bacterium]
MGTAGLPKGRPPGLTGGVRHDTSVKPRRAQIHEAGAVADVWIRSRAASVPAVPPPAHTEAEVRAWFKEVVLPTNEVWVVEASGGILALLVLDDEWIGQLYVDPDHTGQGIGAHLVAVAKEQRPAGLKLWTFEANVGARQFYERHGFVATGATGGDNEEGSPDVRYEWRPPQPASPP